MLKNWLLLASVSCGVGFGSTFLISRNLQQSAWAGLGTVPAVAASIKILSRQRKEEIERQVNKFRLSLDNTQQQERLAKEEIERQVAKSRLSLDNVRQQEQLVKNRCREISAHGQKLQMGFTQLTQEVNRYRVRQAGLEREINSLVLHKQTEESLLVQLEARVLDKQNQLETTNTELDRIQVQRQLQIASGRQSNLQLQSIREDIRQNSAVKEQLESQLTKLQNRSQGLQTILVDKEVDLRGIEYQISQMEERRDRDSIAITDLDRLLQQKQSLLQDVDRQQQQSFQQEILDLLLQRQDQKILFDRLVENISTKQNNLFELDTEISERQANLDRIAIDLVEIEARKQSAIDSANKSESILADISKQISQHCATKVELETEILELQQQRESLQVTIVSLDLIPPVVVTTSEEWEIFFQDDQNLPILQYIQTHGRISTLDVNSIIGNDRLRRGFVGRIDEYNLNFNLPFRIRIENLNNTDYYVKIGENENRNFSSEESPLNTENQQESQEVILGDQEEQEEIQSNSPQDRSDDESIVWHSYFQNDPLFFILRSIDLNGNITRTCVNSLLRIRSLTINFQAELPRYNSNENLPFLITEGRSHTGEEIYIKQLRYC